MTNQIKATQEVPDKPDFVVRIPNKTANQLMRALYVLSDQASDYLDIQPDSTKPISQLYYALLDAGATSWDTTNGRAKS